MFQELLVLSRWSWKLRAKRWNYQSWPQRSRLRCFDAFCLFVFMFFACEVRDASSKLLQSPPHWGWLQRLCQLSGWEGQPPTTIGPIGFLTLFDYSLPLLLATLGRLHLQPISMLKGLLQRVATIFQLHYLFITESAHAHSTEFNM